MDEELADLLRRVRQSGYNRGWADGVTAGYREARREAGAAGAAPPDPRASATRRFSLSHCTSTTCRGYDVILWASGAQCPYCFGDLSPVDVETLRDVPIPYLPTQGDTP